MVIIKTWSFDGVSKLFLSFRMNFFCYFASKISMKDESIKSSMGLNVQNNLLSLVLVQNKWYTKNKQFCCVYLLEGCSDALTSRQTGAFNTEVQESGPPCPQFSNTFIA